jgi:hypothetical protein
MTPLQYSRALGKTRLKARAAFVARRVLVDGLTPTEAARENHLSRQAVAEACRRVEAAHRRNVGAPPGWLCITVCVPPDSAERARVLDAEQDAWRRAGLLV